MRKAQVKAQFVNTTKEFKWRIVRGKEKSRWSKCYDSLLAHKFKNGETWCLATAYWDGSFPIEVPFQVIVSTEA